MAQKNKDSRHHNGDKEEQMFRFDTSKRENLTSCHVGIVTNFFITFCFEIILKMLYRIKHMMANILQLTTKTRLAPGLCFNNSSPNHYTAPIGTIFFRLSRSWCVFLLQQI